MTVKSTDSERERELPDPQEWAPKYGDDLLRYAVLRVGDREVALDLVQDTFLAAFKARESYSGRAAPRTWLVGILKHKIVDHFRRGARDPAAPGTDPGEDLFDARGRWKTPPAAWRDDPSEAFGRQEFWATLQQCLTHLSPKMSSAFTLRELEGLDTEELCNVLGVTATNLWVILHRARMGLRRCLEDNGFGAEPEEVN
jgi:RNA polymerase sigma-70 factor (TIGR02943 family)